MKEYYDFVGETVDGDIIEDSCGIPLTQDEARSYATRLLKQFGGGHIDVIYSDSHICYDSNSDTFYYNNPFCQGFAFDVEV